MKTIEGLTIDEVPLIKFDLNGKLAIKDDNLWILGGNHQRLALIKYIEKLRSNLAKMKHAIKEETKGMTQDQILHMDPEIASKVRDAEERVKELEEKIDSSSMWFIRLYDHSAWYY